MKQIVNSMNRLATERDILNEAIGAIHREAGLRLDVVGREVRKGDKRIDAIIRMPGADNPLVAEIKNGHLMPTWVPSLTSSIISPSQVKACCWRTI